MVVCVCVWGIGKKKELKSEKEERWSNISPLIPNLLIWSMTI